MENGERLKRQKEFLIKTAYWTVWAVAAVLLIKLAGPVLLPFVAAFVVAWLLHFPVDFASEKLHFKRNLAAVFAVVLFYLAVGALLYFVGCKLAGLVRDMFQELTVFLSGTVFPMLEHFFSWVEKISGGAGQGAVSLAAAESESAGVFQKAGTVAKGISGTVINGVSNAAACIPGICMKVLIAVIATVFMELEYHSIITFLGRQIPDKWRKSVSEGKTNLLGTIGKCALSYGLILTMTFAELSAGFLLLKVKRAFVIAFLIAVLDILPVLGTGTVLIPWIVIEIASGDLKLGVGLLVLYLLITIVRNIVEPKLVGKQMGLSPVIMLPCMLLGLKFFGIIGLFGLPFAVACLKSLNDRSVIHIFR